MQGPILGMTAYIQHSSGEGCSQLQKILSATRSFQQRVLATDCNGHSRLWGPAFISENRVGEMVEGVLGSEDLLIINRPNSPATFVNDLGFRSWIDVTAVSHPLVAKVEGWRVHADLEIGSDHQIYYIPNSGQDLKGRHPPMSELEQGELGAFSSRAYGSVAWIFRAD